MLIGYKLQLLALRYDNSAKVHLLKDSTVSEQFKEILDDIQTNLFEAAKSRQEACIRIVTSWDEYVEQVNKKKKVIGWWRKKVVRKETRLGISHGKDEDFGKWYSEEFFDKEIEEMEVEKCMFPLFVTSAVLQKEKTHVAGFEPEVAWVTKAGKSDLDVDLAIRPTSETVIYPYFSKWIRNHHDLPMKVNQWCNVVRWEFSNPMPFIRSREFYWQEGHTAFATKEEADAEVLEILELYRQIYEEFLAVPVIKGKKSELEKFAGALYTCSIESFIPNTGRGIQGATSHCLGQNFSAKEFFDITFQNEKEKKDSVWQNSWAYSTRTIGVMVMVHGDDKGLVLPPKVASQQVIVIPVPYRDANTQEIFDACAVTVKTLRKAGIRANVDKRDYHTPGWKYSYWEMKGVPLRIEIGPKDLTNNQVRAVRPKQRRDACIQIARTWDEFVEALGQKKLILAPWCDEEEVEKDVKERTKGDTGAAKTLCTPFDQPEMHEGTKCFASGKLAKKWSYWGRSY
ncbi:hypothetical protein EZV62_003345 [Acer yangbiense]|uniref:proline--tRNA ligase n=1 Tax=Acer yangbiense TaxID=1000413 RepID=A0A5C7IGF5_9ROSI|nr:hypothetical protein EZV62_003345 [Acer yangbiense]